MVLFYIVKYIRLNIEPAFRLLGQYASPPVRLSVSTSVSKSVRPLEFAILFSTVPGCRQIQFSL